MGDYAKLQSRCQRGEASLSGANNLLAECHAELGKLIAENERLKTLRSVTERDLAQELEVWRNGPSCWDCGDTGDVHDIVGEWRGKCDCNAAKLIDVSYERDQLRAEVAGLKTGYEAYERVNAELKAEVEMLRKYGEEFAVLAERRREEADALRKDSESYRLLSFCHGQGTLELVRSHHELCAEIRRLKILAGEPVPPTPEEFIGPSPEGPTARIRRKLAALGQGEQS